MQKLVSTRITHATSETHGFVSTKFESLDYECYDNEIILKEEERRGKLFLASVMLKRITLFLAIGAMTGVCGALVDIGVHYGCHYKYDFLGEQFNQHFKTNKLLLVIFWILGVQIPALAGSLLVIFIQPYAAGGGIHWVLGYLNGVNLSAHNALTNILVKIPSNILCCSSGLPGGKEAPLIHVGAIVGTLLPMAGWGRFKPFEYFNKDPEKRDMAAAGTAAGLTSAFACPLAGIMLAFEESLSYWNVELTFLIFLCALASYVTVSFIVGILVSGCADCFATEQNLFLEDVHKSDHSYYFLEVFMFIFLGTIGGLSGALWNVLQKRLIMFRKRYITSSKRRIIEMIIISFANAIVQILCIFSMSNYCVKTPGEDKSHFVHHHEIHIPRLNCKNSEEPVLGILFFQSQLSILQSLFTDDESLIGKIPLTVYFIYIFINSCWLCGSFITHGIFVPHILLGAVWGRLTSEITQTIFPHSKLWARPNKFAFLCGAAQLSGSIHITFTISVMMLEICNASALSLPIFITVSVSKFVANIFNESIYHTQVCQAGIPILNKEVPPLLTLLKVTEVMNKSTLVTLPSNASHSVLQDIFGSNNHNGFPIVDSTQMSKEGNFVTYGPLKGLITRSQISIILKNQITDDYFGDTNNLRRISQQIYGAVTKEASLKDQVTRGVISLEPFMNPSPYFIKTNASVSQAYRLFTGLGLRHLLVVTDSLKVVGVITRKDLSIFRYHDVGFWPESHILPLK